MGLFGRSRRQREEKSQLEERWDPATTSRLQREEHWERVAIDAAQRLDEIETWDDHLRLALQLAHAWALRMRMAPEEEREELMAEDGREEWLSALVEMAGELSATSSAEFSLYTVAEAPVPSPSGQYVAVNRTEPERRLVLAMRAGFIDVAAEEKQGIFLRLNMNDKTLWREDDVEYPEGTEFGVYPVSKDDESNNYYIEDEYLLPRHLK